VTDTDIKFKAWRNWQTRPLDYNVFGLGELLGAKMYEDGSGVEWYAYRSKQ
jgi:hypothetical protein